MQNGVVVARKFWFLRQNARHFEITNPLTAQSSYLGKTAQSSYLFKTAQSSSELQYKLNLRNKHIHKFN